MPVSPPPTREPACAAPHRGTPPPRPVTAARRKGPPRPAGRVRGALRLGRDDAEVLCLYLVTRAALWITAYCTGRLFPADPEAREAPGVLAPFERWDWGHYLNIARDGYFPADLSPGSSGGDNREAFFPGFPLVLRAVHVAVPHWTAAGLLISLLAGAVAVVALSRIARHHVPDTRVGRRAVLFLLVSPCGTFLAAGYTEALFLALALPAWLAAQRHDWALAATLTALATTVRVSGLFLAAAVALHFLIVARADRRSWRKAPWLALPAVPAGLYTWYLHAHTGDWMAWKHAQERGWYRDFHAPWEAWSHTWEAAFSQSQTTPYALMFQAELVAMLVGLVLLGFLIRWRRLPEALYLALTLWALGTSYWYTSIPRATLLWWPLWIALAHRARTSRRFTAVYLCLTVPVSMIYAVAFLSGRWAG
ncbi:mannosyltransferase family protein [Streptomyces lateritius]|uniref:Mannosyltransferase family protein n=1 Tax=Streptomyces lateritius TaxID=67313 RepID=A0ABW6YG42_9ACTN